MLQNRTSRAGQSIWLERAVLLAIPVLVLHATSNTFRSMCGGFLSLLDAREWSSLTWFTINLAAVVILLWFRYRSTLAET